MFVAPSYWTAADVSVQLKLCFRASLTFSGLKLVYEGKVRVEKLVVNKSYIPLKLKWFEVFVFVFVFEYLMFVPYFVFPAGLQ